MDGWKGEEGEEGEEGLPRVSVGSFPQVSREERRGWSKEGAALGLSPLPVDQKGLRGGHTDHSPRRGSG